MTTTMAQMDGPLLEPLVCFIFIIFLILFIKKNTDSYIYLVTVTFYSLRPQRRTPPLWCRCRYILYFSYQTELLLFYISNDSLRHRLTTITTTVMTHEQRSKKTTIPKVCGESLLGSIFITFIYQTVVVNNYPSHQSYHHHAR